MRAITVEKSPGEIGWGYVIYTAKVPGSHFIVLVNTEEDIGQRRFAQFRDLGLQTRFVTRIETRRCTAPGGHRCAF